MNKKLPKALGITFALYILGLFGLQATLKDQTFSELENRTLATKPKFTPSSLLDGTYTDNFESYIADQFPLRNQFISIKSNTEKLLQKKENNGVFIGAHDYLLQKFNAPDMALARKNADYINKLASEFNVYVALAPTATKILEHYLPPFSPTYDEKTYINDFYSFLSPKVKTIDLITPLKAHNTEPIYYKTDHHWTTLGAYYGYTTLADKLGFTPLPLDAFNIQTVSSNFYGSLFSKGNFTFSKPDEVQIFYPKKPIQMKVRYEATDTETDSPYALNHLDKKDKYSLFLDGNHPLIKITTSVKNGKKLLVIKDSYANCLVPFLTAHYEEIQILDLRLLNMPLTTYCHEENINDILLLYNVQNFSVEAKLSLLNK